MSLKVIEGSWEEILQHAPELQGRRLRVMVLPDAPATRTGNALWEYLNQIGFFGQWADRTDLPDSPDYVRQQRQQIETRRHETPDRYRCND
ncbi:MAG: hypothetical protein ACK4ME_07645 [Fimbriimonadales bacterium]